MRSVRRRRRPAASRRARTPPTTSFARSIVVSVGSSPTFRAATP
jgi:hypothetical protein